LLIPASIQSRDFAKTSSESAGSAIVRARITAPTIAAKFPITESKGTVQGKIEKVFLGQNENGKCEKCEGALKNAPVVGLVILSGLKKDGSEYTGGQILDPDNGQTYRSKIQLVEGGKKLNVRGYVGVPTLGRSQIWERQE
jgi:uncharacterized protein (DUF2147 family)